MFKRFFSWFSKPFPFFETLREKLTLPVYVGLSVAVILILFNPSQNFENLDLQIFKVISYALIAFGVSATFNIFLPLLFKTFFEIDRWNVWKIILFTVLKIMIIGVANASFAYYFDNLSANINFLNFFWNVLVHTFIIAVVPVVILVFWLEKFFYKKHFRIANATSEKIRSLESKIPENNFFEFDNFRIALDALYYIKSEGNYSTFFYMSEGEVRKKMIRISLKDVEDKFDSQNQFVRCHKSYIVNLEKIQKVEGNARRYNFLLDEQGMVVPVSRSFPKTLLSEID